MIKKLLAGAALLTAATNANAAIIVNGGFEDGPSTGGSFTTLGTGDTSITGWTVTGGSIDYIGGYWPGALGTYHSVDLAGTSLGTISQTIATIAGQWYEVSFYVSKNPDGGADTRTGTVSFDGSSLPFSYSIPTSLSDMHWVQYTYDFLATDSSTVLSFAADASAGCCYGPALDEVDVAAVPEPSTWATLLLGFGAIGFSMRRRRARAQLAQLA